MEKSKPKEGHSEVKKAEKKPKKRVRSYFFSTINNGVTVEAESLEKAKEKVAKIFGKDAEPDKPKEK